MTNWNGRPDGSWSRPGITRDLAEARSDLAPPYEVSRGAEGWTVAIGGSPTIPALGTSELARAAADAHATREAARIGPGLVSSLELSDADWRFSFGEGGLWLRHARHDDVGLGLRADRWWLFSGKRTIGRFAQAAEAAERYPLTAEHADNDVTWRQAGIGRLASSTDLSTDALGSSWTAFADLRGRLVLTTRGGSEAFVLSSERTGYALRRTSVVDLLRPEVDHPGEPLETGLSVPVREAWARLVGQADPDFEPGAADGRAPPP